MSFPFNFSAGPAMLPPEVIEQVRADLPEWHWHGIGQGASVMEVSHRDKPFEALIDEAEKDLRELLAIPDNYRVLFLQGGGWAQFAAIPMNLLRPGENADYLVSGSWSQAAAGEASKFGTVNTVATTKAEDFVRVPSRADWQFSAQSSYVYACSNETVYGNEMHTLPTGLPSPLVLDASSHFLARPMDISACGLIYACVQKNVGPAGVTIVIVREDLLDRAPKNTPAVLHYAHMAKNKSLFNTPPVLAVYITALTLKWIKAQGGVAEMERRAVIRSTRLYQALDANPLFKARVTPADRSRMNVVFSSGQEKTDLAFIKFCEARGLRALKGHRSIGGLRASLYNAMPQAGVEALATALEEFAAIR